MIHIIGGRFNTFEYNTDLHHVYLPALDTWKERAPLPTPRSGHGLVIYRGRFFAMGGEYGVQDEARSRKARYSGRWRVTIRATNTWQSHAPMPTPRHAVGATTIGDAIYVAGGGAVTGGAVQSSVHEAFTLAGLTALAPSLPLAQLGNRHQRVLTNAPSRSLQDGEAGETFWLPFFRSYITEKRFSSFASLAGSVRSFRLRYFSTTLACWSTAMLPTELGRP